ncbi:MAG: DNA internalization-related competence protein ComEC/Rec2 [Candidatus Electrothrix scaldis]|nr:MAG: DNA internalization-related competence protein ComEC/Rec2 [Candidatus Electrothrix sp. GW3-3]
MARPVGSGAASTQSPYLQSIFLNGLRWADRHIFFFAGLSFLLGILSAHSSSFHLPNSLLLGLALLFALISFACWMKGQREDWFSLLLLLPFFFLLGALVLQHQLERSLAKGHLARLLKEQQQVTLRGTLDSMPEVRAEQQEGEEVYISRFEIEVEEVQLHESETSWQSVHGRVRLSMQGKNDALQPGMALIIAARVGPVTAFQTPGAFDYQQFLAAKDIFLTGWAQSVHVLPEQESKGLAGAAISMFHVLTFLPEQVRQQVSHFLRENLPGPIAGIYQALLVGSRTGVSKEIQEQFKATGTMHLLAISGLHMSLLALMVGTILGWLLKRSERVLLHTHVPTLAALGTLPILLGYSFIAGMNTPVLRALIMTLVLFAALILRRKRSLLNILAAAVLVVLLRNPLTLFTASFQLSFSAVAALLLFLPRILPAFFEEPVKRKTGTEQRSWLARLWQGFLLPALLVSLVASLGTLPFALFHFHRFSLIGPIMNLMVEPLLCFWALPWGLAAIPCLFIDPEMAIVLLKIGGLGIEAGHYCTALGADLPWASLWTITPTAGEILVYGVLILLWCLSLRVTVYRRTLRSAVFFGVGALVLHFTWGFFVSENYEGSKVTYLDVGQGSSNLLQLPNGARVLIDGGGNRMSKINIGERVIAPYLWQQRIWRLDQAVITHPHRDHFNGMDFILAHFRPRQLFINGDSRIEGNYQEIIDQAKRLGIAVVVPRSGEKLQEDHNAVLRVVGGGGQGKRQSWESVNDASLVLRYQHGQRSFLFPADIGKQKERELIRQGPLLVADVLLAPHHGSSTSSSATFLDAVDPSLIVVSAGKYGKKHYPSPGNLTAWTERGLPVLITRAEGAISCETDGEELSCLDFRGEQQFLLP